MNAATIWGAQHNRHEARGKNAIIHCNSCCAGTRPCDGLSSAHPGESFGGRDGEVESLTIVAVLLVSGISLAMDAR
jgi:hypothetical protein